MSSSKSAELHKKKDQTWEDEYKNYTLWGYTEDTEDTEEEAEWAMLRGSEEALKRHMSYSSPPIRRVTALIRL